MAMAGFVNDDQAAQGLARDVGPVAPWVPRTRLGGPPPHAAGGPDGHPPYRPGMQVAGDERQQHFAGGLGGNPPFAAVHAQGQQPRQHFAGGLGGNPPFAAVHAQGQQQHFAGGPGGNPPQAAVHAQGQQPQQHFAGGLGGNPPQAAVHAQGQPPQQHFAGGPGGNPPQAAVHAQGQQPQQHFAGPGANRIDGPLGRLAWDQQVPGPDPGVGADRAPEPQQQRALQRMMRRQGPGRRPDLTTLIIYNLPGPFNPTSILQAWPADGTFDYLEIPYNAAEGTFKGHAIINFTSTEHAVAFARAWQGRNLRRYQQEPLNIRYAHVQGLRALVNRFRGKDLGRLNRHGHLPSLFEGAERLNSRVELRALFGQ